MISKNYVKLVSNIKRIIHKARYSSFYAVNTEMLKAYFEIGKKIVEEEQKGRKRAGYGKKLIENISSELTNEFGKGFSTTAIKNMRIFYNI